MFRPIAKAVLSQIPPPGEMRGEQLFFCILFF